MTAQLTSQQRTTCGPYVKRQLCAECDPLSAHLFLVEENAKRDFVIMCSTFCSDYFDACKGATLVISGNPVVIGAGQTKQDFCNLNTKPDSAYCYPFNASVLPPPSGIEIAFPNLAFSEMVDLKADQSSNYMYAVSKSGIIWSFINDPATSVKNVFLDISALVYDNGEMGLLGMALHPNFATNKYFFVNYVQQTPRISNIVRYTAINKTTADPSSAYTILQVNQPYDNHNAGGLYFANDGKLLIPFGDGGSGGDPQNRSQNTMELLGKVLRLDVDDPNLVPADNPFVNTPGYDPKIWALGVRNPWRCSIDKPTGLFYCGDVGQNVVEEISIIERGKNYGWKLVEGDRCYVSGCSLNDSRFTPPIYSYDHTVGQSITGGYIYRGKAVPSLFGKYIFGDYQVGKIWYLDGSPGAYTAVQFATLGGISSFAVDKNDELYLLSMSSSSIWKLKSALPPTGIPVTFPPTTTRPTVAPTTSRPTVAPTTTRPTVAPTTSKPTDAPTTSRPTVAPTTNRPTDSPTTSRPTAAPTTNKPTDSPTTRRPTAAPTQKPTFAPTTRVPTSLAPLVPPSPGPTAPKACRSLNVGFYVESRFGTGMSLQWFINTVSGQPAIVSANLVISAATGTTFTGLRNLNQVGPMTWSIAIPSPSLPTSSFNFKMVVSPQVRLSWSITNIYTVNGLCATQSGEPASYTGSV
eukprot:TRINITY_DN1326_c0_g1_i2.p1 TRINITY_DN1326_c0_g1~~TRINITY_DN1326_c0_g1_i2.p1  ORF type:complete len:762 (-),score=167.27 TRINITY_DN1326_c0_g1_i2:82-2154(-)